MRPTGVLRTIKLATVAVLVGLAPASARGDAPVEALRPSASSSSHVATESSQVLPKWTPSAGLLTTWDQAFARGAADVAIHRRLTAHVVAALGIAGWAELGLALPLVVHQAGVVLERGQAVRAAPQGAGDLRIGAKGTILRTPRRGWGLGLAFDVTAPTGRLDALAGAGAPSFAPQILFENRGAHAILSSFNVGYRARNEVLYGGVLAGDAVTYRAAVRVPLSAREQWSVFTELDGAIAVFRGAQSPLALRGGLRWQARGGMVMSVFAGGAPLRALGIPNVQGGFSLAYAPPRRMRSERAFDGAHRPGPVEVARYYDPQVRAAAAATVDGAPEDPADPDGDGIVTADRCPQVPEDVDGFEDGDGCPELDNDRDGLRDGVDLCPTAPELVNGYLDWDGCPDRRNGDGTGETFASFDARRILPAIVFSAGSSTLDADAQAQLTRLAELLRLNPWMERVRLGVFVPASADAAKDIALANARATAIALALQRTGVALGRVEVLPAKTVRKATDARVRLSLGKAKPAGPVLEAQGPPATESPAPR